MISHVFVNPQQGDLDWVLPDTQVAIVSQNDVLVMNTDTSHNVIVRAVSNQLIDGAATKTLAALKSGLFVSDGVAWHSLVGA